MSGTQIKDAVIFVTGANRGIGKAYVEEAVKLGAAKVYAGARKIEMLDELVSQAPEKIVPIQLDVTQSDQIQAAAQVATDVNVLINNAGFASYSGYAVNHDPGAARNEMAVNYEGMVNMVLAFLPILKKNGSAVIANVVSVGGLQNFPFAATYCASKAAAHSFTQGLRAELEDQNIFVAGIYPGPVDTDMAAGVDMEKETPNQVALNSYKGIESGIQTIMPDKFAVDFLETLQIA